MPESAASATPAPPHIYTLTGNLLAEYTWECSDVTIGRTHRARSESFQVGGKGINVSRMLQRLGTPCTALCFAGGPTGDACLQWLRARPLAHHAFRCTAPTRQGLVIRPSGGGLTSGQPETTFLGCDSPPDAAAITACAHYIDALPAGNILAFSGSFPGWQGIHCDPLRLALERWITHSPLVVDSYGPPLLWLARQPVHLLKINAEELRQLIPSARTIPDALAFARRNYRVCNWIITDGPRPVHLSLAGQPPSTHTPPAIPREVSATGSGDVLLATLLHFYYHQNLSLADALIRSLPYASANAAHPGIADFDLNQLP